jgi:predicted deacetylase
VGRAPARDAGDPFFMPGPAQPAAERHLCVVLHDVAPATWEGCGRVLREVARVARARHVTLPLTLLVIPQRHGCTAAPPGYLGWLHRMARGGHELALHGLTHHDDGPPPRGLAERLLRRHYTAGEGEFAALSYDRAAERLAAGRAWAAAHGLEMAGFVPPAWLLGSEAWQALGASGFAYTCTFGRVVTLPEGRAIAAPGLVFSTRTAWRRALAPAWNRLRALQWRHAPLLRLDLHPGDADHAAVRRCWSALLAQALERRTPLRLHEAAAQARHEPRLAAAGGAP